MGNAEVKVTRLLASTLVLAGAAWATASAQPSDEEAIRQIPARFEAAWNQHDMNALASLFAEDADFVNVAGTWWKGRQEIEQAHARTHATIFRISTLRLGQVKVRFLKPDVSVAHVSWGLSGDANPDGAPRPPRAGVMSLVVVKQNGLWLVASAHNTNLLANPPPR
ncbi:MAG: SgcJ/EcaC family oxidoreductase [Candidatus Acidiferrales bacterium]